MKYPFLIYIIFKISMLNKIEAYSVGGIGRREDYPFTLYLTERISPGNWLTGCAVVLVHENWVITLSQCILRKQPRDGSYYRNIRDILIFDPYTEEVFIPSHMLVPTPSTYKINEIALIRLKEPIKISERFVPASLSNPHCRGNLPVTLFYKTGTLLSRRNLHPKHTKESLIYAPVNLLNIGECQTKHSANIQLSDEMNICTYNKYASISYPFDCNETADILLGSPLFLGPMHYGQIYGLLAQAHNNSICGWKKNPEVYVKVSPYFGWIQKVIYDANKFLLGSKQYDDYMSDAANNKIEIEIPLKVHNPHRDSTKHNVFEIRPTPTGFTNYRPINTTTEHRKHTKHHKKHRKKPHRHHHHRRPHHHHKNITGLPYVTTRMHNVSGIGTNRYNISGITTRGPHISGITTNRYNISGITTRRHNIPGIATNRYNISGITTRVHNIPGIATNRYNISGIPTRGDNISGITTRRDHISEGTTKYVTQPYVPTVYTEHTRKKHRKTKKPLSEYPVPTKPGKYSESASDEDSSALDLDDDEILRNPPPVTPDPCKNATRDNCFKDMKLFIVYYENKKSLGIIQCPLRMLIVGATSASLLNVFIYRSC